MPSQRSPLFSNDSVAQPLDAVFPDEGGSSSPARRSILTPSSARPSKNKPDAAQSQPGGDMNKRVQFGHCTQLLILIGFVSCDVLKNRYNEVSVRGTQVLSQTLPITVGALSIIISLLLAAVLGGEQSVKVEELFLRFFSFRIL